MALGFVPEGFEETIQQSGAVEVLSSVYTQFAAGGGAAKIDVNGVIGEMTGLADECVGLVVVVGDVTTAKHGRLLPPSLTPSSSQRRLLPPPSSASSCPIKIRRHCPRPPPHTHTSTMHSP